MVIHNPLARNVTKIITAFLISWFVLYTVTYVCRDSYSTHQIFYRLPGATLFSPNTSATFQIPGSGTLKFGEAVELADDEIYIDRLLSTGFDNTSCLSRHQSYKYRKPSPFKPSTYLLSKLRHYEKLHNHCGPDTRPYNEALKQLKHDNFTLKSQTECNYVVWRSYNGLGNRMLSLSATFLYALLTNRVLLIEHGSLTHMTDLFCEPFPKSSWLLPQDFPFYQNFWQFYQESPKSLGNMLKNNLLDSSTKEVPLYLYINLNHNSDHYDKLFYCEEEQTLLSRVPWLILGSNQYFVPSLYLITSFEQELSKLFPNKETTFHHLGRYLFHPTNQVWEMIKSYYDTNLGKADEMIGIQMRSFDGPAVFPQLKHQMLSCIVKEKLLPELNTSDLPFSTISVKNPKSIAVLVTSLNPEFYETLKELYWEFQTVGGERVRFYQASHEESQQSFKHMHERKAWAEIYLLSLSDKLVTSGQSTFGYVAQGLGGLKPWIIYRPENGKVMDPSCRRAMSIEPCFHYPPFWNCKAKIETDIRNLVFHVRQCEDFSWGVKLVDD